MKNTERTYRVYVNGSPAKKTFKASSDKSLWTAFNAWAKGRGASERVIDSSFLGSMGWKLENGTAEVREEA